MILYILECPQVNERTCPGDTTMYVSLRENELILASDQS